MNGCGGTLSIFGTRRVCRQRVHHVTRALFAFLLNLGPLGLFALGVADSSFLFAPLGNDVLLIALVARKPEVIHALFYAAIATAGSVLGCLVVDLIFRKAGEAGLDRHLPRKRLDYVKRKVNRNAAWALLLACLAPPPFPFTPFIMAASALEYPRKRLLSVVAAGRIVRFAVVAVLGLTFGTRILQWSSNEGVQISLFALVVLCVGGSIASGYGWIRRSRKVAGAGVPS